MKLAVHGCNAAPRDRFLTTVAQGTSAGMIMHLAIRHTLVLKKNYRPEKVGDIPKKIKTKSFNDKNSKKIFKLPFFFVVTFLKEKIGSDYRKYLHH